MPRPLTLTASLAAVFVVSLTGCGYDPGMVTAGSPPPVASQDVSLDRLEVAGALGPSVACGSGTRRIEEAGMHIALTGDCAKVEIVGDGVKLTAEHVGELTIKGYGVLVLAESIGSIDLSQGADASLVQWEVGEPEIVDASETSVLRKAG